MKNGLYPITLKGLGTKYMLKAQSGVLNVYDTTMDKFIKTITKEVLSEFYDVSEPLQQDTKLYDIHWFVGSKVVEKIIMLASYSVCVHKANELKRFSHKTGKLLIVLHT